MEQQLYSVRKSGIHGTGLFAGTGIKKGTKIIQYIGEKVSSQEGKRRAELHEKLSAEGKITGAVYIFELNENYDIDGSFEYNTARLINHSCNPNCEIEIENDEIWIVSKRDINQGEELTYNYGFDLDDGKKSTCKCGSENCIGFIVGEDYRDALINEIKNSALSK